MPQFYAKMQETSGWAQEDRSEPKHADQHQEEKSQTDSSAVFSSLSQVSKLSGRTNGSHGTNMLLASDGSDDTWRKLDKQVNKYPGQREFKAIGFNQAAASAEGGPACSFRDAMVHAVERVVGSVHVECVSERPSRTGTYTSVTVGPVWVENGEQVLAIYNAMREDSRLKYFI
eukprot:CAMPEP_0202859848 /NCGR_PEP_ID=MMETSP1391-20130828/1796_1 /ASSEMBLY_ACC=CAM_ASM_000867 /TAXON_ID=1034604 /ORGANISM="Chlamydomonas leiostraca, Strain SAG 11-49" /LENGTH=172 /DNA_ID=CAMNT_0049538943 /DNA_START=96 /DNA_END=615 /DNA_ORIENTATION=+